MTPRPMAVPAAIASTGDRCLSLTRARPVGNAWTLPIANAVRLATFTPALEFASVELMIAKKTNTQNKPYKALATPTQEAAPVPVVNVEKRVGPKLTSIA